MPSSPVACSALYSALRLAACLAVVACAHRGTSPPRPVDVAAEPRIVSIDSALFAATIAAVPRVAWQQLRVDPRALAPNPALVSLHPIGEVVPEYIGAAEAALSPLAREGSATLRARKSVLRAAGIPETDAIKDAECPGLLGIDADLGARRRAKCPATGQFESALIALPREGGPYWPNRVDQRPEYIGRPVYTVRVLLRSMASGGSAELSRDMVFERTPAGTWRFVKHVDLLLVE